MINDFEKFIEFIRNNQSKFANEFGVSRQKMFSFCIEPPIKLRKFCDICNCLEIDINDLDGENYRAIVKEKMNKKGLKIKQIATIADFSLRTAYGFFLLNNSQLQLHIKYWHKWNDLLEERKQWQLKQIRKER